MKYILGSAFFVFLFFAYAIQNTAKQILREPASSWTEDVRGDCAVVLTGGSGRTREGLDMLSRGEIKKLIISGVRTTTQLREILPQWPFYGNLNAKDIVLEKRSSTTWGNAQQTLPLIEALGCREVILITSRLHMYRAYSTFRGVLPETMKIIKRSVVSGRYNPDWSEVGVEVIKTLFYRFWAF